VEITELMANGRMKKESSNSLFSNMQTVILKPLHHRQQECIGIYFENSSQLNTAIRKNAGARWSQTNKCWYILLSKENYNKLFFALKGKAKIEQSALHKYLADKKTKNKTIIPKEPAITKNNTPVNKPVWINKQVTVYKTQNIKDINAHVLPAMEQHLKLKAYSPSTIKTYLGEMVQLLSLLNTIPADNLKPEHLKRYLLHCYEKLKLTENTLHSRINAMKFYYEQVLGREKFFWEIPRPKKQYILPKVLGESELKRLFTALINKKHKAILFTAYSAGLRVSEVVNLELKHIDRSRMQLLIKNAKGKKDRYVMLSPLLIDILTNYYKTSKPRPEKYVFEGPEPGTPYSSSSMQKIFQVARKNAGIQKQVSFHSLRHSFATHLLEKGVDIKYIRDLLGHFDIKTTARYLHVKREQLVNIESPLDGLMSKEEI
jgi:site-specific recombinase XerD